MKFFRSTSDTNLIKDDKLERKIYIEFQYKNDKRIIELNLGTLFLKEHEFFKWNYEDCKCISNSEDSPTETEHIIISLKKMCIILDLLDE
jgi:hypothetical protein